MQEERKTLEQRAQMTDIERLRHSSAHVLASCHVDRKSCPERSRMGGDISRYSLKGRWPNKKRPDDSLWNP